MSKIRHCPGSIPPNHVAAAGYVLMAAIRSDVLDPVLAPPLEAFAADTCTDPGELRHRIDARAARPPRHDA